MICRSCGAGNSDDANFCTRCGAELRSSGHTPHGRRRRTGPVVLILLLVLILLVAVLALAGIVGVGARHSATSTLPPPLTATPAPTPSPTPPTSFHFTDPFTSVSATATSPKVDQSGDAGLIPSPGKEFVIVPVSVHNGGNRMMTYFGLDFSAYDQNDNQYQRVPTSKYPRPDGSYIGFGAMTRGQTRSGVVVFELPLNTRTVTIKWDDSKHINPPRILGTFHLQ